MARRALALLLTFALASPGSLALAQAQTSPLQSVDPAPAARPEPATVLPPPPARALPATPRPKPLAVPPTSIDDLLNQGTDLEPQGAAPVAPSDSRLTSEQLDLRIRGASAAAQALQGPMDGAWTLRDDQGTALYTFQFADPANNPSGALEGAWRDLRRADGLGGAGLIASIQRGPGRLQAAFNPRGGPGGASDTASVSLTQGADGSWTGQLNQGGAVQRVRMIRTEPMLNAAPLRTAAGDVVSPYRTPASNTRAAAPAAKAKKGPAAKRSKTKGGAKKSASKTAPAKKRKR
jgi:hypothetical protein